MAFDLSTGHISRATSIFLDEAAYALPRLDMPGAGDLPAWWVAVTPYGWLFRYPAEDDPAWPADLAACIAYARCQGGDNAGASGGYILFDRDEPAIDGLEQHDW